MSTKLLLVIVCIVLQVTLSLQQAGPPSSNGPPPSSGPPPSASGSPTTPPPSSSSSSSSSTTGSGSTPASCTPYLCPSIKHDSSVPNPKALAPNSLHIGLLQSTYRTDPNAISLAKYAAYAINSDASVLQNVSIEIYSQSSMGVVNMDAATIALFELANISALIVDTDEDTTLSVAQVAAAFGAPVISLSSITEAFAKKTNYPSMLRMSASNRYETTAIIEILTELQKNTSIFIYTQDTYGYAAANDFVLQAQSRNISVYSIGIPSSGNTDVALQQVSNMVGENWNVFIIAVNTQQASRVLMYMNASGHIGNEYLYIFSPNVERIFLNSSSSLAPLADGAIALMPRQLNIDSPSFPTFYEFWNFINTTTFPGARPYPVTGYLAYDAVMAFAYALNNLMLSSAYPSFPSTAFMDSLKSVSFSGLSGDVSFDSNGDRIGDYVVMNHVGRTSVAVGIFSVRSNNVSLSQPFTFFNGSTVTPMLLNVTVNLTFFCSYTPSPPQLPSGGPAGGPDGPGRPPAGGMPPPSSSSGGPPGEGSGSDDDNGTSTTPPAGGGPLHQPQPIVTGAIDPNNSSRCICHPGYAGDRCNLQVRIPVYKRSLPDTSIALGVIIGVAVLVAVFASVMLVVYWEHFRRHGSFYCAVIITGVYFSYGSVLVLLPVPTPSLCILFPWLLGIGFTLVYGCLFIKTWTLYKVYRSAEQLKKTTLTPMYIIKGIGLYLVVELLILIIWTAVDRPGVVYHHMIDDTYQLQCTAHPTFWAIFAGSKSLWLVFGAVLSVLTRNVAEEYSESKSIAYATYNIMALLVIAIPLAIALRNVPGGLMIVEVGVIVIAFTFTMCSLFFGIWLQILQSDKMQIPSLNLGLTFNASARRSSSQTPRSSNNSPRSSNNSPRSTTSRSTHSSADTVIRV